MRTLYLDCSMGAAGDMLTAALLELTAQPELVLGKLNAAGIPGICFKASKVVKCGITGTAVDVLIDGESEGELHHGHGHGHHHHSGLADIEQVISSLSLPAKVRDDALAVFRIIAGAESSVHGVPVTDIHFHEVGTMDAVADVTAVCYLLRELQPGDIIASPVNTGSGQVRCAHGILPVPAPATALILKGIPAYGGEIKSELCTPTGAALLKYFVNRFGSMPVMKTEAIGYGMGKKDFDAANCVRAMLGETSGETDSVTELACNLDDMTPEAVAYACEKLLEGGALDVYTVPIGMKKGRAGIMLCALCRPGDKADIVKLMFKHTSTIGIRETGFNRFVLSRSAGEQATPYGAVRYKVSSGYGVTRKKYEYDDIARIAGETGESISDVLKKLGD